MNYNKTLTILLITVTVIIFIEIIILIMMKTGNYTSPLCLDPVLINYGSK